MALQALKIITLSPSLGMSDKQFGAYVSEVLLPFLTECARHRGAPQLLFGPRILEWLESDDNRAREGLRLIKELARAKAVELPRRFRFDPHPLLLTPWQREVQIEEYERFWTKRGIEVVATTFEDLRSLAEGSYVVILEDTDQARLRAALALLRGEIHLDNFAVSPLPPITESPVTTRVSDLEREAREILPQAEAMHDDHAIHDRFLRCRSSLAAAAHWEPHAKGENLIRLRQKQYHAITQAQVDLDAIRHPDVDPNVGWVRWEGDAKRVRSVDTQLMRIYFDELGLGGITDFEYKPRKANLASPVWPLSSFCTSLVKRPEQARELMSFTDNIARKANSFVITKQTPGLLGLRFKEDHASYQLQREYTFRAGIGAHLPYSTTGFALEYWVDGATAPAAQDLVLQGHLLLPSAERAPLELRPLSAVGGVQPPLKSREDALLLQHNAVEGGLYGLRCVDKREDFVLDLRSAHQLNALGVQLLKDESGAFLGLTVSLFIEARRAFRDDKANTLFLSIE